jgi:hypothetical protein
MVCALVRLNLLVATRNLLGSSSALSSLYYLVVEVALVSRHSNVSEGEVVYSCCQRHSVMMTPSWSD